MIESYLLKLNPRAVEKFHALPEPVKRQVTERFYRHVYCCAKLELPPDPQWLLEVIEHSGKAYSDVAGADAIDFLDAIGEPITY